MPDSLKRSATPGTVYVVDDEQEFRRALQPVLEGAGWGVREFSSGGEFLRQVEEDHPACVLLDLMMPGVDGLEVQGALAARSIDLPIIFLSGRATIPMAAKAIQQGAVDFLVKPVDPDLLTQRVTAAMEEDLRRAARAAERNRLLALTEREVEVCELLARGLGSKQIAQVLSIAVRTVEHHRERILRKTGTTNVAELAGLFARVRAVRSPSNSN